MARPICAYSCLVICTERRLARPQGRAGLRRHLRSPDDLLEEACCLKHVAACWRIACQERSTSGFVAFQILGNEIVIA
jgi:hypothetical protein